MTPVSNTNTAALRIVEQIANRTETEKVQPHGETSVMIAAANGLDVETDSPDPSHRARLKIDESVFSVQHIDITERKMKLFEDVGEALGISEDGYDTPLAYATALRIEVNAILEDEDGRGWQIIREIEKELGLDDLGMTLDEVISAIANPDGASDRKLTDALEEMFNGDEKEKDNEKATEELERKLDEFGRYDRFF